MVMHHVERPTPHQVIGSEQEQVLARFVVARAELVLPAFRGEGDRFERSVRALAADDRHLVTLFVKAPGEVVDHELDAAVTAGRHGKPRAYDKRYPAGPHTDRTRDREKVCSNVVRERFTR